MKTAVIYVRVRDAKHPQESIKQQLDTCLQFANENQFSVVGTYIDIEEFGKCTKRSYLTQMIKDSATATWNAVITYGVERISRKMRTIATYHKKLAKYGKSLICVTSPNYERILDFIKMSDEIYKRRKV